MDRNPKGGLVELLEFAAQPCTCDVYYHEHNCPKCRGADTILKRDDIQSAYETTKNKGYIRDAYPVVALTRRGKILLKRIHLED
jgi:hypothetical protein